jgi:hypothetical protein
MQTKLLQDASKATVETGTEFVKLVTLVNGGAIAGLLTFMGVLAGRSTVALKDVFSLLICLWPFVFGIVFATLCLGCGWIANSLSVAIIQSRELSFERPYVKEGANADSWRRKQWWAANASFASGIAAVAFFCVGVFSVVRGLQQLPEKSVPALQQNIGDPA